MIRNSNRILLLIVVSYLEVHKNPTFCVCGSDIFGDQMSPIRMIKPRIIYTVKGKWPNKYTK